MTLPEDDRKLETQSPPSATDELVPAKQSQGQADLLDFGVIISFFAVFLLLLQSPVSDRTLQVYLLTSSEIICQRSLRLAQKEKANDDSDKHLKK
jgi:hypothetical protein